MKYLICFSLTLCYILFIKDINAMFTKDHCLNCCWGLPRNTTYCIHACNQKFMRSQEYNSRSDCNRSCLTDLAECKNNCLQDCSERFIEDVPGIRPPPRMERERRERREARQAAGLLTGWRSTRDPRATRKKYKPRKKKDSPASSSTS